jgi:hypothetical protein
MAQKTSTKTPAKSAKPATPAKGKAVKAKPAATGPLAKMKALGGKDKLVDQIAGSLAHARRRGLDQDRLTKASNAQLLRLASVTEAVKKAYGSRDKLVDELIKALGRAKDKDYVAKLGTFSLPKLYDLAKSTERKAKAAKKA